MADEPSKPSVFTPFPTYPSVPPASAASGGSADGAGVPEDDPSVDTPGGSITDFVRRAVSAGVGAASRSKDDIVRVAAAEMRTWLEHLNLNEEIAKALSKMVIEVKTEIRFRPLEDGKLVPDASSEVKVKKGPGAGGSGG